MHAIEVRTIAKVAKRLVPFLIVCYFIAYLDRVNVGFAALTMNQDLGLSQTAFGFGAGRFMESEPEGRKMLSHAPQDFREIIVQDNGGRGRSQLLCRAAANCLANMINLVEEGPNEFI